MSKQTWEYDGEIGGVILYGENYYIEVVEYCMHVLYRSGGIRVRSFHDLEEAIISGEAL